MDQVTGLTNAVMTAFSGALGVFMAMIPKLIGFLAILIIGWFIASLVTKAVELVLRNVKFNDLANKAGISGVIAKSGLQTDASGLLAMVIKWFIRIIVMVVAFDALGLTAVSDIFTRLLNWLPNLLVAMVILVIGGWAANAVSALVRGAAAAAESTNTDMVANISRIAVLVLTGVIAVNQLGIASELVQIFFTAVVGALALGLGLAVGLGGKDLAGEILRKLYEGKNKK